MLSGIAKIKTVYFDNLNDSYFKNIKRLCQDDIEVYHSVSRNKTIDKIATMYDILNYI